MEASKDESNISSKAGKLYFNRFCIEEDAACELSGVYYLKSEEPLRITLKRKAKGKPVYSVGLLPGQNWFFKIGVSAKYKKGKTFAREFNTSREF